MYGLWSRGSLARTLGFSPKCIVIQAQIDYHLLLHTSIMTVIKYYGKISYITNKIVCAL